VLAGGEGKRLSPLTADRAKPAVPFGGIYRLVDFVLSNLVNAGYLRIVVLTQYKSHSLDKHITTTWRMSTLLGNYVTPVPAQQRLGPQWFRGSADAIHQSLNLVYDEQPEHVVVFGADHVYRMDPRQMVDQHVASGAGVTVAGHPGAPRRGEGLRRHPDRADGRRSRRSSRSRRPAGACRTTRTRLRVDGQLRLLDRGAARGGEGRRRRRGLRARHGRQHHPDDGRRATAEVYDFSDNDVPGATDRDRGYWRDVGTLDSYYDAHMDLVSIHPVFNLYNRQWPILTTSPALPPAKFVFEEAGRIGQAVDSLVSQGVIVSGGRCGGRRLAGRAGALRARRSRQRAAAQRRRRARAPSCATRSSTRTSWSSRARRSASTPRATASAADRHDNGVVVAGKGLRIPV
jgi:glucose-1-phosphate adenylyltransferase